MKLLIIGLGGFLGSVMRYLVSTYVQKGFQNESYPWGTFAVNIFGCLVMGFVGGLVINRNFLSSEGRFFIMAGFLGGFTTFSTFGYETFSLIRETEFLLAGLNILFQILFGLIAVFLGFRLSNLL